MEFFLLTSLSFFLLETPTSKSPTNDLIRDTSRSRSSQMSFGSPMEIDYSIDVGNIEVLTSKAKFSDDEEQSGAKINEQFGDGEQSGINQRQISNYEIIR